MELRQGLQRTTWNDPEIPIWQLFSLSLQGWHNASSLRHINDWYPYYSNTLNETLVSRHVLVGITAMSH